MRKDNEKMAEKIDISELKQVSFSDKGAKPFTEALADPASKLSLGSVGAYAAADAAALALKAVRCCPSDEPVMKTAAADLEKLRGYFVFLIDEENKAKLPLEKRLNTGAPEQEIEAGYRTACMIQSEILYTSIRMIDVIGSVADMICPCSAHLCAAALIYLKTSLDSARLMLAHLAAGMKDEVSAHTTRREPEIAIAGVADRLSALTAKFEAAIG